MSRTLSSLLSRPRHYLRRAAVARERLPLAGFRYHHGERLWPLLQPGQPLRLVREPDNPYDPLAVRIDWRGRKLGYLPRTGNASIARLLDQGQPLEVRIKALRDSPSAWERVEIEVWQPLH